MVDVLDTGDWSPRQALLKAMGDEEQIDYVAVAYVRKGEEFPRLTCSSMKPLEMNFLGFALQSYALETMKEA